MLKTITIGVVSVFAIASAAYAAETRSEAKEMVTGSCQMSQEDCLATVRTLIANTVQCPLDAADPTQGCGCAPNRTEVLQGVGDAAQILINTDAAVARLIQTEVGGAPACYASAGSVDRPLESGSPG